MKTLVIGLGQRVAGDDGVGLAVLDEVERRRLPGVELVRARDASELVELLPRYAHVVVVDAVLVSPEHVGKVSILEADALEPGARSPVSSHGMSAAQAIALSRALHPDEPGAHVLLVGIGIQRPTCYQRALSEPVQQAVDAAADRIAALTRDSHA